MVALHKLKQQPSLLKINALIAYEEITQAVTKLSNRKSPGLNKVPPGAFKALDKQYLLTWLDFFNTFWREEIDFDKWHEGQLVPVPKSGDLSDPNKWREVTLMDIGSKIFNSIMCTRLFKIINKHGVKYQFGSTPGVGCQDGSFTKTMLHLRYNHNLPTFVMFADLVKAFNTSNHKLMVAILKKYGCPPKLCSAIRRMYTDKNLRLIMGKIDLSIPFEVGVKQGGSVVLVLFLFIMMAFAETLKEEWVKNYFKMIKFRQKVTHPNLRDK